MRLSTLLFLFFFFLINPACSSSSVEDEEMEVVSTIEVDTSLFELAGLTSSITEESCILSGGTGTTCYRFSVASLPTEHDTGPWCPRNISDDASQGGIWLEGGVAYDVDGAFVENLATFYNDSVWQLYQADGTINVTDTQESCDLAARPNVDPAYNNYCVECQPSYLGEGTLATYMIPKNPVPLTSASDTGNPIGIAFNGVNFDPPAPTDAILAAHTLAPFDDCGGHVNLVAGYHYHAATGCSKEIAQEDEHAPMIGYAMDSFPMFGLLDQNGAEPSDLDSCRGHSDETRGYHYHVDEAGANRFVGCFMGEAGCAFEGDAGSQTCDATQNTGRRGAPRGGPRPIRSPHEHQ